MTKLLVPQLVPSPLWGKSLASGTLPGWPKSRWVRLRVKVYEASGHKCVYCSGVAGPNVRRAPTNPGGLHANEVWTYMVNGDSGTQTLTAIEAVCPDCDAIIHFGRISNIVTQDELTRLLDRMADLNHMSVAKVNEAIRNARQEWEARSLIKNWTQDLSVAETFET
jgi:hypothetical protein